MLQEIDAKQAQALIKKGKALLFDIREADEYAREHIPGACLTPLSKFDAATLEGDHGKAAIFHCTGGVRTAQSAPLLCRCGFKEVYHLKGGIKDWKAAGLPTSINQAAPRFNIMQQVQITAGGLILAGLGLGLSVSPWWLILDGIVGVGMLLAGTTGFCLMAKILGHMPWNRIKE